MRLRQAVFLVTGFSMALLAGGVMQAQAGFVWMPAEKAAAPAPSSAPQMPAEKVAPIQAVPLSATAKDKPAPVETVSGFGKNLPLNFALQQIVPPAYKVILAPDVKGSTPVSWNGKGEAWQQVLSETLSPVKLGFSLDAHSVTVKRQQASSAQVTSAKEKYAIPQEMIAAQKQYPAPPPAVPAPAAPQPAAPASSSPNAALTPSLSSAVAVPEMAAPEMSDDSAAPPAPLQPAPAQMAAPPAPVPIAASPAVLPTLPPVATETAQKDLPRAMQPVTPKTASEFAAKIPTVWQAKKGESLKSVLGAWASAAQVHLYWAIDYDYKLNGDVDYKGSFSAAASELLNMFAGVTPQPYGELHANKGAGDVLVIRTYGLSN